MGQPVAWFEIISPDVERAKKYYSELFGWQVTADPSGEGYSIVDTQSGEGAIGGGIASTEPGSGPSIRIYMRVEDIGAHFKRAVALGGKELVPPTDLPGGWGKFAVFADPDGNQVGLWA
jgi:predicted enzyme related to lactoylglutathione lyase